MIEKLVRLYNDGAITGYQLMTDCLHMLDPEHPELVLQGLPDEIYEQILEYAARYDPRRATPKERIIPAPDQIEAAVNWIKVMRDSGSKDRININESYELEDWAKYFGVSKDKIRETVEKVGPMIKDVERVLHQ